MKLAILRALAGFVGFGCAALAQTVPPALQSAPVNLDFSQGKPGEAPPAWASPPNSAETAADPACYRGASCAQLHGEATASRAAFVYQVVDAAPFRGGTVVFRAAVRRGPPC